VVVVVVLVVVMRIFGGAAMLVVMVVVVVEVVVLLLLLLVVVEVVVEVGVLMVVFEDFRGFRFLLFCTLCPKKLRHSIIRTHLTVFFIASSDAKADCAVTRNT
jgi:hypothetical protein